MSSIIECSSTSNTFEVTEINHSVDTVLVIHHYSVIETSVNPAYNTTALHPTLKRVAHNSYDLRNSIDHEDFQGRNFEADDNA